MTEKLSLRERATYDIVRRLHPIKELVKKWYYHAGMKFLQNRTLTDEQEFFLEDVTDFFIENLENIEKDKSFIRKVVLDPIKLPEKKVKKES